MTTARITADTAAVPSVSITERLNRYYENNQATLDDDIMQAQYDLLEGDDW